MIDGSPHLTWNFSDCSVALWFVFLTQQQRLNCVDVIISMRIASAAARTPVDCSELHQQPADAVLRPTFVHKLCCKLSSIVTFTFIQIFDQNFVSFTEQRQSWCVCLIQRQNLRYYRCPPVSGLKDEKLIKKQTYMKTETCKLYSKLIDFWIFLPNTIKIDRYNFELYHFKVGPFFWDTVYNQGDLRNLVYSAAVLDLLLDVIGQRWRKQAIVRQRSAIER